MSSHKHARGGDSPHQPCCDRFLCCLDQHLIFILLRSLFSRFLFVNEESTELTMATPNVLVIPTREQHRPVSNFVRGSVCRDRKNKHLLFTIKDTNSEANVVLLAKRCCSSTFLLFDVSDLGNVDYVTEAISAGEFSSRQDEKYVGVFVCKQTKGGYKCFNFTLDHGTNKETIVSTFYEYGRIGLNIIWAVSLTDSNVISYSTQKSVISLSMPL